MIRAGIIAIALMSLPTSAFAYCGNSADGNFSVNCQNGVKVFRHNAPSSIPVGSCLLYTSPSPRDQRGSRMPSSA